MSLKLLLVTTKSYVTEPLLRYILSVVGISSNIVTIPTELYKTRVKKA
jgi:hypothetical protein